MKKRLTVLLALLMVITIVGCSEKKVDSSPAAPADETEAVSDTAADATGEDSAIPQIPSDGDVTRSETLNAEIPTTDSYMPAPTAMVKDFPVLIQYPELPTGCEVTSLTMVLNFNQLAADKCDIADNYLEKGEVGTVDFRVAFEGDPRDENSYGCYAPVIVKAADKYLTANNSSLRATDLTGTAFTDLFAYVDKGIPVIVWGTLDCEEGHYSVTWEVDGKELTWFTPEHCMVLLGYSDYQVWVADPVHGDIQVFDRELFRVRYESLGQQAVVIQ